MHPLDKWLKDRKAAGEKIRKSDIAELANCSASRLSQITKNGRPPSLKLAKRLSDVTGIPIEQFAEGR